MGDNGYALDLLSPVRHVATEMDRVAPAALSVEEMAATYRHPNPGDFARVRLHEHCASDDEAVAWLIGRAVQAIARRGKSGQVQVAEHDGGYRLVVPFDALRYDGRKLERERNDHARLRDPFNPMSVQPIAGAPGGERRFSENVRRNTGKDSMDELRESMREFGWIEQFPAIEDERGVVLVGHRRLNVAAELGIAPVRMTVELGVGDAADARRFAIAIASNLGAKPFTPEERKDLAEYLYGERDWTMARIAEALKVHVDTISQDLSDVPKPKSRGGRPRSLTPEQERQIREGYFDQGKTIEQVAKEVVGPDANKTPASVIKVVDQERGRREERERAQQMPPTEPPAKHTCTCPSCGVVHTLP
jgi:ParB-like chromosome segregation protein Spo0J